jgi:hypothetical protein
MRSRLLEEFLSEECTPYVRGLLEAALEAARAGSGPTRRRFEFNRFEVTLDVAGEEVVLEDVLDPAQSGELKLPLSEFYGALDRVGVDGTERVQ